MSTPLASLTQKNDYVWSLHSVLNVGSWTGVGNPSYALQKDEDVFEKFRLDPNIASAMDTLQSEIAGAGYTIQPGDPDDPLSIEAANVMGELVEGLDWHEILDEFAQVVYTGAEYACLEWGDPMDPYDEGFEYRELGNVAGQYWRIPSRVKDIDRRRIRYRVRRDPDQFGRANMGKIIMFTELWSVERGDWEPLLDEGWLIRHIYGDEECRLGYGRGLLDSLYTIHYAKMVALREWGNWVERFGQGQVVFSFDPERHASKGKSNDALVQDLVDKAKNFLARHVAAIANTEKYEVVDPSSGGVNGLIAFLNYCDEVSMRRILGSLLPSGTNQGAGSLARANVEMQTTGKRVKFHRARLGRAVTQGIIAQIWRENWIQFVDAGLGLAKMPKFTVDEDPPVLDPVQEATKDKTLSEMGLPLSKSDLYERHNRKPPKDAMDELKPAPKIFDFGSGGFGMPGAGPKGPPKDGPEGEVVDEEEPDAGPAPSVPSPTIRKP